MGWPPLADASFGEKIGQRRAVMWLATVYGLLRCPRRSVSRCACGRRLFARRKDPYVRALGLGNVRGI